VVKGVRFANLRDAGDPAACARRYAEDGADELVLLDVDATPSGKATAVATVAAVRAELPLPLTVGGGVRSVQDAEALLASGADKVAVNTAAVADPGLLGALAERFGRQCVVIAVDAAAHPGAGAAVCTHGGRVRTGLDAVAWARTAVAAGAGEVLLTSLDRDGTQTGYDLELLRAVAAAVPVPVVASGGARTAVDVAAALRAGAAAALLASRLHDGELTIAGIKRELAASGVAVRS
jgi:cyclase